MGAARIGKTLANFRVLECLGSGGSGMIWKAEDLSLGRTVALKALRAELATDAEMSQRFRDEARTLAKLSHVNVASLYSLIEDDDGLYLVMEYVEGNTLAALLATSGPLPLDTAYALFHQVLDGVGHAHEAGIVHRDLKPANLMVDARGRVKVMDFGIARVTGAARTTHHGKLVGTPEYMSPEQVRGEDATVRSDLYSLGILLFEMVAGRPPFRASASFELMRAQIEDPPPDPRQLRPELSPRVAAAILRALAKRPAERFSTTRELQDELLDAGAARRGSAIAPVWSELPPPISSSEAPTIANFERPPGLTRTASAPALTEPHDAWARAVNALEDDLGARAEPLPGAPASKAHATVVMDVAQETARLVDARPTRMLADAPFAASARAIGASSEQSRAPRALLWIALAAGGFALALGLIRIRARAHDAAPPPASARTPSEVPALPHATTAPAPARPRERTPTPSEDALPDRSAPVTKPAHAKPAPHRAAQAAPHAPAATPPTQGGDWVIRR